MVERTLISLPSQLQLIERLQHLIYLSSSLLFVSGESGTGKSTLTENLSNVLPSDLQQVYISLSNGPTIEKLRQQIISQLYDNPLFNADDKLLVTIERLQRTANKNTLIIIDNAEILPADFIVELCELFLDMNLAQDNTFNVLLLANEKANKAHLDYIEEHLISRAQALLNHVELKIPVLSSHEANALLQHNFEQAGYQAELQHQDALNQQLKSCVGNPQKIIKLADDLTHGIIKHESSSWIKTRLPAIFLMLFLIAIVTMLAMYLYPKFLPSQLIIKEAQSIIIDNDGKGTFKQSIPDNNVQVTINQKPVVATNTNNGQEEALAGSWAISESEIKDNKNNVGLSDVTEQRVVISNQELIEITSLAEAPKKESAALSTEQTTTQTSLQIQQESYDETPLIAIDKNGSLESTNIDLNKSSSIVNEASLSDSTLVSAESGVLEKETQSVILKDDLIGFTDNDILLSKGANNFTLQLSGMASEKTLLLFKVNHDLPQENIFIYETVRKTKPWFVVTYGEYNSFESASLAAKNLPSTFKGMPTWIKKWQVVHNDLRLNNE